MADSRWQRFLCLFIMTFFVFAVIILREPSLVINPVLTVGVLHSERIFASDATRRCNETIEGISGAKTTTESTSQHQIEKCMISTKDINYCSQENHDNWSFNCTVTCPEINRSLPKLNDAFIDIVNMCTEEDVSDISSGTFNSIFMTTSLYSIPERSPCLYDVINTMCNDTLPVPNLVHYVWFSRKEMNFYHFLSFVSVLKHQKPCLIFVHSDVKPYGIYWDYLLTLASNIVHVIMTPPTEIHGREIGRVEHQADVARLLILQEYGGIYMDTDEIILKSLDPLRIFNFTLSHALNDNLSNGLILSAPNAEFISHWLDGYSTYTKTQWAYHSTILPYKLSKSFPSLLHIEDRTFVRPNYTELKLLFHANINWTINYGIHLYIRFYEYMHNFDDIRHLNTTMGSVARYIIYDTKELCDR